MFNITRLNTGRPKYSIIDEKDFLELEKLRKEMNVAEEEVIEEEIKQYYVMKEFVELNNTIADAIYYSKPLEDEIEKIKALIEESSIGLESVIDYYRL